MNRFAKDAKAAKIADRELCEKARLAEKGNVYANLGGGVAKVKLNKALHRGMILIKGGKHMVFALLFAKKDMENVSENVLEFLQSQADQISKLTDDQIAEAIKKNILIVVECSSDEDKSKEAVSDGQK